MEPARPLHFPEHAERCLDALVAHDLGHQISLGGAFGLLRGLVREWHGLPELPFLGQEIPEIRDDPNLAFI